MAVEKIQYQAGSVTGHGALVWNEKVSGKRPLLLVMPNWLGVTDIAIKRAGKMAGDKYVAFVADMYGNGKTSAGPPESQDLMMAVRSDRVEGRKRVAAALATMVAEADKRGIGDASRKAAVGFCFGGGNVLELARSGADARCRGLPARRPRHHHAGQEGRHQSRGVRDPRLQGSGGAEGASATSSKPSWTAPAPIGRCSISAGGCTPSARRRP